MRREMTIARSDRHGCRTAFSSAKRTAVADFYRGKSLRMLIG